MGSRNPERYSGPPDWHTHRTLGQMKDAGWRLATWCMKCGAGAPADIDQLIELRGREASPWDRYVVCGYRNCRGRAVFKAATSGADLWYQLTRNIDAGGMTGFPLDGRATGCPMIRASATRPHYTSTPDSTELLAPRSTTM